MADDGLLVQIASYNTNLQGNQGLPQDLVDWLSPTLQVSTFLSRNPKAPDIIAVGFQELLPLHLGLAGISGAVIKNRAAHILSQIEANAPNKERFSLLAKAVNGGVAMLVYAKDDGIARKVKEVQTSWTSCGPLYMGNKGAVGVRFRVAEHDDDAGETFTFVCAHMTAHKEKLKDRIWDYKHIVGSLLFDPLPGTQSRSTIYSTSHLFFLGDLNFRLDVPEDHTLATVFKQPSVSANLDPESTRESLKEFDQLSCERRKGSVFVSLREGDFWKFKCTYKYLLGEVDKYSGNRTPSWTDRILYTTYSDSPDTPDKSDIANILYTSVPSYTTSDHKPVVALLLLNPRRPTTSIPLLQLPDYFKPTPDPRSTIKRFCGRILDRVVGIAWWILTLFGIGSLGVGIFNIVVGLACWNWWKSSTTHGLVH
ncbi:Endonuclease/exonuclease/phosphatase [Mycena floridula]|nr:Endonuclease/exonuclease/phosphatase [Mycena floridula]